MDIATLYEWIICPMRLVASLLCPLGVFPYGLDDGGRRVSARWWSLGVFGCQLCASSYNYARVMSDRLGRGVTLPAVLPMLLSTLTLLLAALALSRLQSTALQLSRILQLSLQPPALTLNFCLATQLCLVAGIVSTGLVGTDRPGFRAFYMGILCLMHLLLLSLTVQVQSFPIR
ncbi:hypothetical protein AAG570_003417 [Ranatra chinensis]|uniref:Uncharacterized protein n=1 Tax=Ranatra chinensis TaxID=642074 RepID=A0ABD0Y3Q0_9HEMI